MAAEECSTLKFDACDGAAHITLIRQEAANALNLDISQDLLRAVLRCDEEARWLDEHKSV